MDVVLGAPREESIQIWLHVDKGGTVAKSGAELLGVGEVPRSVVNRKVLHLPD